MTLGEKIRYTRKFAGLSQEQLAERLCVSRSAIAKWETDKGMPDIENFKLLSQLLGVSMDSLLNDHSPLIRQPIRLAGRGCDRVKKDRLMKERFPTAEIWALQGRPELEPVTVDSSLGFLTPTPFGAPEFVKSLRETQREFYLVEQNHQQALVNVTEDCLTVRPLPRRLTDRTFALDSWVFVRCEQI